MADRPLTGVPVRLTCKYIGKRTMKGAHFDTAFIVDPELAIDGRCQDPVYLVSRSTRGGKPNASIVSVDKIRRACHPVPKYDRAVDRRLTKDNALDTATDLCVNLYISVDHRTLPE
ncbi:uncharacterized protein B0H18DRAFT_959771 [Fomitopsis serialis]|uniref:uncharacterized protein n=1 Tax=Fomitopsis serialis TaxID=139415 RepID=UPI002007F3F4|nr:uncharacterized protein B0H18DRAFT_959771 [Neoantrodia serialis]KAH9914556.1 hypothetical protein B0H18DRAFT_959771 [Neoantrodia serialis]